MAHRAGAAVVAVGAALALAAGLRHAATEYPADKELGRWSSYFSLNSQVKLVRNPSYHAYVSSQLDPMRSIGDAPADAVVANVPQALWHHPQLWVLVKMVAARGITYEEAATLLQQDAAAGEVDLRTAAFPKEDSPEAVLCKQMRTVPEWVNAEQLEAGREVHEMNAVAIGTVLLCGSLVLSYACKNGNKVLMETRRLSASLQGVWRRLAETWHFVLAVQGAKDSLAVGSSGFDAAANVRLLHAVVRRYCQRKEWNAAVYGHPINQEDMLGTLASFSPCVVIGMEKMGLCFTTEEQDAYCARWRYVGYLLGLTPDALALISNYASARYVGEVIALRQLAPDEDSARLTTMSLEAVESHYPVLSKLPKPMKSVLSFWCRWFLGNDLADAMQVPKPRWVTLVWWAFVRTLMRLGFFFSRRFPFLAPIWKALNRFHASRTSRVEFGGKKRIPIAFKTA